MGKSRTLRYQVGREYLINGKMYLVTSSRSEAKGTIATLKDRRGNIIKRKS